MSRKINFQDFTNFEFLHIIFIDVSIDVALKVKILDQQSVLWENLYIIFEFRKYECLCDFLYISFDKKTRFYLF